MIADEVCGALGGTNPVLDPQLARSVACIGWRRLAAAGIGHAEYSTERALTADAALKKVELARLREPLGSQITVERFAAGVPKRYADLGIAESRAPTPRLTQALDAGLRALSSVEVATGIVEALVRSVHCIEALDPETDVSYSDPEVPFSIFVGVHAEPVANEGLRIAEAILHETMHLHLSLIEDVVPLVAGASERWSSPWRVTERPTQGVLHGLFVFRAVSDFLALFCRTSTLDAAASEYLQKRRRSIRHEIAETGSIVASEELTLAGRTLAIGLTEQRKALPVA